MKQKHGNGFLALDKRVQWLTNNTLISLSEIPEEVLQTYSTDPTRLRGFNKKSSTLPKLSKKSSKIVSANTNVLAPIKAKKIPISNKKKQQKNIPAVPVHKYFND